MLKLFLMNDHLIRTYKYLDLKIIKDHLLVYGALSGTCEKCQETDVKVDSMTCPACKTDFKYIAFREVKSHMPKIHKLKLERNNVEIIDYDDYKHHVASSKARDFLL